MRGTSGKDIWPYILEQFMENLLNNSERFVKKINCNNIAFILADNKYCMARKVKGLGQVYTPREIVLDVLDAAGYYGSTILKKNIMENSCGPGAFLTEIVSRYISEFEISNNNTKQLKTQLEKYIHAIDIDLENVKTTINALDKIAEKHGIKNVKWDIICADTLTVSDFDGKMDYVVGNPPYVRVHNLEKSYSAVKKFSFAQDGMTDIYIVFFEIGLRMLKKGGILSYITASSYYNSLAGTKLREYINNTKSVYKIIDLGHFNPFEEVTYTAITCFEKGKMFDKLEYNCYDSNTGRPYKVDSIPYDELFVDGNILLMEGSKSRKEFADIYSIDRSKHSEVVVKNGFATLADRVFIIESKKKTNNMIDVYKGSTGTWKKCIYPYDKNGKLIPFDKLDKNVQNLLLENRDELTKRSLEKNSDWYSFGRTQAISDVYKTKIAINALIRDTDSIKIEELPPGTGVYSGIYILSKYSLEEVEAALRSDDFVKYIKAIKKYKNGGYYTFSTSDVNKYLLYKLSKISNTQTTLGDFKGIQSSAQPCQ